MLIKNILQLPEFEALRNQYVSFVQVGGEILGKDVLHLRVHMGFWLLNHKEINNERIKCLFILCQLEMYIDEVDTDKDQRMIRMIKEMLVDLYTSACEETAQFTDHAYMNAVKMEISEFKIKTCVLR